MKVAPQVLQVPEDLSLCELEPVYFDLQSNFQSYEPLFEHEKPLLDSQFNRTLYHLYQIFGHQ